MRNLIRLPQLAWYEPKDLELRLPDHWQVEVCNMAGYNRPAMTDEQTRDGGDLVLICNAPQGQVVHYLFGCWSETLGGHLGKIQVPIPSHINHLIVYTEYPDIPGLGYFEQPDKVLMMTNWDDVLHTLQDLHRGNATVAVYPNADIQCFG